MNQIEVEFAEYQSITDLFDGAIDTRAPARIEETWRTSELVRVVCEQVERDQLRHPVSFETAYRVMGLLLGTLPPAAIFWKLFGYGIWSESPFLSQSWFVAPLLLAMNLVCAGAGILAPDFNIHWITRARFRTGILITDDRPIEYIHWLTFLLVLPFSGAFWGLVTGAAGGAVCFGFGILYGPIFAIPVGLVGFSVFGLLHRLLQRDGMIEARLLLPLVIGVAMTITVGILGIPYPGFR